MVGGQSTFLPLKVNTAGVIPIIFCIFTDAVPDCYIFISKISGNRCLETDFKWIKSG